MRDYGYPSVFFAYFFFSLLVAGALFFLFRSVKDGDWVVVGATPETLFARSRTGPGARRAKKPNIECWKMTKRRQREDLLKN